MMDFNERPNTDISTIVFLPGIVFGLIKSVCLYKISFILKEIQ